MIHFTTLSAMQQQLAAICFLLQKGSAVEPGDFCSSWAKGLCFRPSCWTLKQQQQEQSSSKAAWEEFPSIPAQLSNLGGK